MWIITAQQHISPEVTVKGFKKRYISTAVDGTDAMLQNSSKRSECEDEDIDCEGDRDTDW